jgi:hypothetical protein
MTFKRVDKVVEVNGVITLDVAEIAIRFMDGLNGVENEYPPGTDFVAMLASFEAYSPGAARQMVAGGKAVVEYVLAQIAPTSEPGRLQ